MKVTTNYFLSLPKAKKCSQKAKMSLKFNALEKQRDFYLKDNRAKAIREYRMYVR